MNEPQAQQVDINQAFQALREERNKLLGQRRVLLAIAQGEVIDIPNWEQEKQAYLDRIQLEQDKESY